MRTILVGLENEYGEGIKPYDQLSKIHFIDFEAKNNRNFSPQTRINKLVPTYGYHERDDIKLSLSTTLRLWQSAPFFTSFFGNSKSNRFFEYEFELDLMKYERRSLIITSDVGEPVAYLGCAVDEINIDIETNEFCQMQVMMLAKDIIRYNPTNIASDIRRAERPVAFDQIKIKLGGDTNPIYLATRLNLSFSRGLHDSTYMVGGGKRYIQTQKDPTEITGSISLLTSTKNNYLKDILDNDEFTEMKIELQSPEISLELNYPQIYIDEYSITSQYSDEYLEIDFENIGEMSMKVIRYG